MSVVVVTGGSGTFGKPLVPLLRERGHELRLVARRRGVGTHTWDELDAAANGAELVLHAASDGRRLGRPDLELTRRVLAAAAGARHLLYLSIVGVDRIPYRYYRAKLACEREIEAGVVPHTIFRATQFHQLLEGVLRRVERRRVAPLPLAWRFQPVAVAEVAARSVALLEGEPLGRAPDFGGPEILSARRIVEVWRERHGRPRTVIPVWWPGRVYSGFRRGLHTTPGHADGRQTWAEYVSDG